MVLDSHRPLLAAVAAAAALVVAGCGEDEETDTAAEDTAGDTATEQTDTGATGDGAAASTAEVAAVEFAFEPPDPAIEEDGDVSIELTNDGEFPHALTIEETNDSSEEIQGGESTTMQADLDSGEYTIFCPVGDHRAQGMEGTLTVGGGGSSDSSSSDDSGSGDDSASAGSGAGY